MLLLFWTYEELDSRFAEVQAFLGPAEIAHRHPNHLISAGKPLAPGQRAFARIASGTISYHQSSLPVPLLSQMQVSIVDGTLRRNSSGRILAHLETRAPFREMQARIEQLGLSFQIYDTTDEYLSLSPVKPTTFQYLADEMFPLGMDPATFKPQELEAPIRVQIRARAIGHLDRQTFSGKFINEMKFAGQQGILEAVGEGRFEFRLA